MVCKEKRRTFKANVEAASEARLWVEDALSGWGVDDRDPAFEFVPDVMLVVSELTTNAIKSRSEQVVVHVIAHRHYIEVGVDDDDPAPASLRDASEHGGRGLRIVDAVTSQWGQRSHDGCTKTVWGRVPIPARSKLAEGCRL